MKRSNERSLDEAIVDMIELLGLRERLDEQKVREGWEEVAGRLVARHTRTLRLRDGRLTITVDSAPLRQELGFLRTVMAEQINRRLGREVVREVVVA